MKTFSLPGWSGVRAIGLGAALALTTAFGALAQPFNEAPMLSEQVAAGLLPPVEERLPVRPRVLDALEVGQYGGTWRRAYRGPGDRWGPTKLMEERALKWFADPEGNLSLKPAFMEEYSVNEDSTEFTFTLLEGLKWSDGHPVTTEDVAFWYNDIFLNPSIVPTIDPTFAPGGTPMELEVVDDRTFIVRFAQPYVYFLTILAKDSTGEPSLDRPSFLFPKHYLSRFNDRYATEEELAALAAEYGAERWTDLWGSRGSITSWWLNPDLPVLTAWRIETPPPGDVVTMVRNPYYYKVDQAGNQLPYIDRIEHRLFEAQDAFNLMVVQGQIDMQMRYANVNDFTFYMENTEKGDYQVMPWLAASTWSLLPNHTTTDPALSELFANKEVRRAMSIGIDRELINELAFSGLAKPRAAAPVTGSPNYSAELAAHWTEYDPDTANAILDAEGYAERDSGGFRLHPGGGRVQIVVEANSDAYANTLELLAANYAEIGIELLPRIIDRTQWDDNRRNNAFQMQYTGFDRLSVVAADPRRMMGNDSFAVEYFTWYQTGGASGMEPPADHPIRQVWAAWDRASTAGTLAEADAAMEELIETFVTEGWVIGIVGEMAVLAIVRNDFRNMRPGLIEDDVMRGVGLAMPQQFWMATN
jgi:peptide/nickel transport system substrate-binding protein